MRRSARVARSRSLGPGEQRVGNGRGTRPDVFERKHKHLHRNVNPLDGTREEIVARLGVLLHELSDRDLEDIGLQRIEVVE